MFSRENFNRDKVDVSRAHFIVRPKSKTLAVQTFVWEQIKQTLHPTTQHNEKSLFALHHKILTVVSVSLKQRVAHNILYYYTYNT